MIEQPVLSAGDRPFTLQTNQWTLPSHRDALKLIDVYFDVCAPTYRFLHKPTLLSWLDVMMENFQRGLEVFANLGHAKAATLLSVFAIAGLHTASASPVAGSPRGNMTTVDMTQQYATTLTDSETGMPTLSSLQARLLQVFYLLMTSRFNRAWYLFGTCLQMISSLGLHRRPLKSSELASKKNYIKQQACKRTFWAAYILDKYLGVVLGRPVHFRDDEIDQTLPDRVNDEDMTAEGFQINTLDECRLDAFVFNIKLAEIVGAISRDVYSIRPAHHSDHIGRLSSQLDRWYEELPAFLSSIRSSSLVRSLRRQSEALQLAHCHALMHLYRPLMLGHHSKTHTRPGHHRCITAAHTTLRIVDALAREAPTFQAFWWTHYVAFCALAIVYVWRIQRYRLPAAYEDDYAQTSLFELAAKCHQHLAEATLENSPSRRYSVILEELRKQADDPRGANVENATETGQPNSTLPDIAQLPDQFAAELDWLDGWQITDWLSLDASVSPQYRR
jgi:hypothetical protein